MIMCHRGSATGTAFLAAAYGSVVWWWKRRRQVQSFDPKEQPPPLDRELIDLLDERDGRVSIVVLDDGRQLQVLDIAWGYDWGDEYAHVLANISPEANGMSLEFFYTSRVVAVIAEDGVPLYRR